MSPLNPHHSTSAGASTHGPTLRWLALLFSTGTLLCCALPILLVFIGLGAAFASLTAALPMLVTLAAHKAWVFALAAVFIAAAGYSTFRPGRSCPADPALAAACERAHRLSARLFWATTAIWSTGFALAYLALPVRIWLGY